MIKDFFALVISVITVVGVSKASSSQEILEDEFVVVQNTNTHAEPLFPAKFTAEQMSKLFNHEPVVFEIEHHRWDCDQFGRPCHVITKEAIGSLIPGGTFYQDVMPSSFQILTGTAQSYADKINFTRTVQFENGVLSGIYEYRSSYETLYELAGYAGSISFPVTLTLDPSYKLICTHNKMSGRQRLFNLRDSILGARDFISSKNSLDPKNGLLPQLCLHSIFTTDEKFVRQTGEEQRLTFNIKDFLMVKQELQYGTLYNLPDDDRRAVADKLYHDLLSSKGYKADQMNLTRYEHCLLTARSAILSHLGIHESDIPTLGRDLIIPLVEGKVLLLLPERGN